MNEEEENRQVWMGEAVEDSSLGRGDSCCRLGNATDVGKANSTKTQPAEGEVCQLGGQLICCQFVGFLFVD